jgi:Outer membrane lipoprotein-sorting protein
MLYSRLGRRSRVMRSMVAVGAAVVLALGPRPARAAEGPRIETPSESEIEQELPAGKVLRGREIYDRFLHNRKKLHTLRQDGRILSQDPAGNPQETRFSLYAKDYRDRDEKPVAGIYSKTVVMLSGPFDIRWTAYLYVHRSDRADDQYSYSPARRRISRISLKGQSLAGTDFSFDDFLVSADDLENAEYDRRPDEAVDEVPCYVVEAVMKPDAKSRYTRTVSWVEKAHFVPLRTRYWDHGVAVKELTSPADKIREFDGAWVPTESRMTDLLEGTSSTFHLDQLDPNPTLDDHDFDLSVLLEQHS